MKDNGYATVIGTWNKLSPKCKNCIYLRKVETNTNNDFYECSKAPLMFPENCLWFTDSMRVVF